MTTIRKGQRVTLESGLQAVVITVPDNNGDFKAIDVAMILGTRVYNTSQVINVTDGHYDEWDEVIKNYVSPYSKY